MIYLPASNPNRRAGFTLVETAIATVMVGGLLVVALNMVGASRITQTRYADRQQALILAEDLLQEVLARPYEDPDEGITILFGLELGELLSIRINLDDADDYNGYSDSPPEDADGNAIPGAGDYTRSVAVDWVERDDPTTVSASETGVKKVTVAVSKGGRPAVVLRGFVTADWPGADEMEDFSP